MDQTGHDVYAARLDASGNLLDTTPIIVSQDFGSQQAPEVAWNGQTWIVIWEHETPSGTGGAPPKKIFGARVAPDGTTFLPLVDIPVEYGSLTAPLPPDTSGAVYIRLVDTDRTPGHYPMDRVSVDFMSIDIFVSIPFADSFESGDTSLWTLTVP